MRERSLLRDKLTRTLHAGACFDSYKMMLGDEKLNAGPCFVVKEWHTPPHFV